MLIVEKDTTFNFFFPSSSVLQMYQVACQPVSLPQNPELATWSPYARRRRRNDDGRHGQQREPRTTFFCHAWSMYKRIGAPSSFRQLVVL